MTEPTTRAGRWLVDRSHWDSGMRGFFVRINATAGPEDMRVHVLAIEREARADLPARIEALERVISTANDCAGGPRLLGICGCTCHPAIREASDDRA